MSFHPQASFQRSNSHDKVRKIVAEEGRAARNLIAWSNTLKLFFHKCVFFFFFPYSLVHAPSPQNTGVENKNSSGTLLDKGPEKSPTKTRQPRKVDLRARYWAFLFDNLRRAVDEIYVTCESDQSVLECKEVLMMLDNYVRDFKALIDWIQLQEKLEKTDAQNRPTSLAWEVRKMSPGRHVMPSPTADRLAPSSSARRTLNFSGPSSSLAAVRLSHTGPSWADRVKCTQSISSSGQPTTSLAERPGTKSYSQPHPTVDAEGWETVHRGRTAKPRSAAIVAKVSPVLAHVIPRQNCTKGKPSHLLPSEDLRTQSTLTLLSLDSSSHSSPIQYSLMSHLYSVFQEHLSLKKYIVDILTDGSVSSESVKDGEERQKARKKAKKLRARMNSRAKEYEASMEARNQVPDSPYKAKLQRLVKDLLKQLQGQDGGQWANNKASGLDRTLGEIARIVEKQNNADQVAFQMGGGLLALEQILQVITAVSTPTALPRIPLKSLCAAVNVYYLACSCCALNCSYVLFSNKIVLLVDLLLHQLTLFVPDEDKSSMFGRSVNKQIFEGLTTGLLHIIATILSSPMPEPGQGENTWAPSPDAKGKSSASESFNARTQDLISYVVNMGLIDKLYGCFLSVQGPVDDHPKMSAFLQQASALLHSLCKMCFAITGRVPNIFDNKRQDPTGLTALLQSTDLVGVVHSLYCILLHSFVPESTSQSQEPYSPGVIQVALQGIRFLNSFAILDLSAFQCVLGAEGLSLAFRHIVSSLLWYCTQHSSEELLHEVIICVGYFTVNHPDNQVIVQSGRQPSVLQKLCQLPFQYFSHPRLIRVLFPSLISACYNNPQNKVILQQEMSCVLLATFIQVVMEASPHTHNINISITFQMTQNSSFCEIRL
uniref:S phase cyclin A-associated protein in the endoplasmic reticulum N-terminal domain-containing protein n=1 Tax=Gouania willdenowi TaxID=441366 RepID=A0A8C5N7A2_GOUWI